MLIKKLKKEKKLKMSKLKKIFTNVRVLICLFLLVAAIVAIHPGLREGVAIRGVVKDSAAALAGFESPKPTSMPMSREVIERINNIPIESVDEYNAVIQKFEPNKTIQIQTNKKIYRVTIKPKTETTTLNETELKTIEEIKQVNKTINGTKQIVNETVNVTKRVPKTKTVVVGTEDIGLAVYDAPKSNIRKGLDLEGGTRVLLQPEEELSAADLETVLSNMKERLNVYGLSDVVIRDATDLSGNQYLLIEIAGANEQEVKNLIAKQGKFEAKIENSTIFKGGNDITYVCRTAECSGIYSATGCGQLAAGGWSCKFTFAISLNPDAAQRQADVTQQLKVITIDEDGNPIPQEEQYLDKKIDLFLDDELVDSLNIGASLKGRAETDISISGPGFGNTEQEARFNAINNMKRLQTILITGSLPVKLKIVKTDNISPVLGKDFINSALILALVIIVAVGAVVFVRFKSLKVSIPIMITMLSEVVMLLGFAALVSWNMDLAAIAGIIIAAGTGVDNQIVIADEILSHRKQQIILDWKTRIKNAFFIITGSYLTIVVAMIPLLFAGAGLLKGFGFITIVGASIGVIIARPAYAAIVEILSKD